MCVWGGGASCVAVPYLLICCSHPLNNLAEARKSTGLDIACSVKACHQVALTSAHGAASDISQWRPYLYCIIVGSLFCWAGGHCYGNVRRLVGGTHQLTR